MMLNATEKGYSRRICARVPQENVKNADVKNAELRIVVSHRV